MADWTTEYLQQIEDCQKRDHLISAKDADFLDSIKIQLEEKRPLSPKQIEWLDDIWERATLRG